MSTAPLFDELYERYESWFKRNLVIAESEARLVEYMMRGAPRPILEVGVGTGFFASRVKAEVGLDPSANMLLVARERGIPLLVRGVGERMPFRDSVFGSILIVVTLCFVDNPLEVLRESHRILRDDGILVSCIVPRDSTWGSYYEMLGAKGHPFYSKARFYTLGEVEWMLKTTGFKVMESMGVLSYPPGVEPKLEDPMSDVKGKGFICIKSIKVR